MEWVNTARVAGKETRIERHRSSIDGAFFVLENRHRESSQLLGPRKFSERGRSHLPLFIRAECPIVNRSGRLIASQERAQPPRGAWQLVGAKRWSTYRFADLFARWHSVAFGLAAGHRYRVNWRTTGAAPREGTRGNGGTDGWEDGGAIYGRWVIRTYVRERSLPLSSAIRSRYLTSQIAESSLQSHVCRQLLASKKLQICCYRSNGRTDA